MLKSPKITVLMPVYNCAPYVAEAINSILNQTFTDFEFVIIDDASTDETVIIIQSYSDSRIKLIQKTENTGLTKNLNYGLSIAKGEYIARMDGDDISLPERFSKQVLFMDSHLDVIACGTAYQIINSDKVKRYPVNHEDIKIRLLNKTCFAHPTVMMRTAALIEYSVSYNESFTVAQDYDLWVRLIAYGEFHNLPEVLLKYRVHESQVSQKRTIEKDKNYYIIKLNVLKYLNISYSENEKDLLERIINRRILQYKDIASYQKIKDKMILANENKIFKKSGFDAYLKELEYLLFKDYFLNRKNFFPKLILQYSKINRTFGYKLLLKDQFKLIAKSLIYYAK